MSDKPDWLPPLVLFEAFGGDWDQYLDALYAFFKEDFIHRVAFFKAERVVLKRHPIEKGKEATFWHLISAGSSEKDRLPELRRCERIRWPRPVIGQADDIVIKVWENKRSNEKRICLWLEKQEYLVVLAKRSGYIVLWTAYLVTTDHQKNKLQKEYETHKMANAAPGDGIVTPSTHGR
jgi:hypothetical protein